MRDDGRLASDEFREFLDRHLIALTQRNMKLEKVSEIASRTAASLHQLSIEFQVMEFSESVTFAELEEEFWGSYSFTAGSGDPS